MDPIKDIRVGHIRVMYPGKKRFKVVIEGACTLPPYCACADSAGPPVFSVADVDDRRFVLILEEAIKLYKK